MIVCINAIVYFVGKVLDIYQWSFGRRIPLIAFVQRIALAENKLNLGKTIEQFVFSHEL